MERIVLLVGVSYLFHLVATVIWLGWSVLLVIARASEKKAYGSDVVDLDRFVRETMPIAMLAFAALAVTGLYQMVTDTHYDDVLTFDNAWSQLLLLKHLAFGAEAVALLAVRFVLEPDLNYYRRLAARGDGSDGLRRTRQRYRWAAWFNLALGGVILALTGVLTALP